MTRITRTGLPGLRDLTPARVALPTAGHSIATAEVLDFQLAHARARDAVHAALDLSSFARRIVEEIPLLHDGGIPVLCLRSNAPARTSYLRHPDFGRTLDPSSAATLQPGPFDIGLVIADGLSALAVERNAIPLLAALIPKLFTEGWSLAPITLVAQGRVAIGDPIGSLLGARCSLILIGERPGLSAADSLGAYLTWDPRPGRTDAERNCLSNIRDGGVSAEAAASRLHWYLRAAHARQLSGVGLKEGTLELDSAPQAALMADDSLTGL